MAKLLIVEDDESVRTLAARALERDGHNVDIAADGAQGLALIQQSGGSYDLVVSDIRMPEMDGIEMAMAAAKRFPAMKIMRPLPKQPPLRIAMMIAGHVVYGLAVAIAYQFIERTAS